jgi:NADH-quinone oxidoreductase subunit H
MNDRAESLMDAAPPADLPRTVRDAVSPTVTLASVILFASAVLSISVIAFGPYVQLVQNLNIGLFFVFGVNLLGVFGIILGGWTSSEQGAVLAAFRSTAQFVSYQVVAGLSLLGGFLLAGTLNIRSIVEAQRHYSVWFIFLAPVSFFLYFACTLAATNRDAFECPDSELFVYRAGAPSVSRRSLYFLGDYANGLVIASVAATLFLGGWLRPFPNVYWLSWLDATPAAFFATLALLRWYRAGKQEDGPSRARLRVAVFVFFTLAVFFVAVGAAGYFTWPALLAPLKSLQPGFYGAFWFLAKVAVFQKLFALVRSALPPYRFAQSMSAVWSLFLPLALVNIFAIAIAMALESERGWNRWLALSITTIPVLFLAFYLLRWSDSRSSAASLASFLAETDPYAG